MLLFLLGTFLRGFKILYRHNSVSTCLLAFHMPIKSAISTIQVNVCHKFATMRILRLQNLNAAKTGQKQPSTAALTTL